MAPDPRRIRSEQLSPVNGDMQALPEEEIVNAINNIDPDDIPEGYTLFTAFNNNIDDSDATDDELDNDDDENGENSPEDEETSDGYCQAGTFGPSSSSELSSGRPREADDVSSATRRISRQDIEIDCDKIKAAMASFTLPPSSIPEWASGMSDSVISTHINKLLTVKDVTNK